MPSSLRSMKLIKFIPFHAVFGIAIDHTTSQSKFVVSAR